MKRLRRAVNHSPSSSVDVNNKWSYTSAAPYAFKTWTGKFLRFSPLLYSVRQSRPANPISQACATIKVYYLPMVHNRVALKEY